MSEEAPITVNPLAMGAALPVDDSATGEYDHLWDAAGQQQQPESAAPQQSVAQPEATQPPAVNQPANQQPQHPAQPKPQQPQAQGSRKLVDAFAEVFPDGIDYENDDDLLDYFGEASGALAELQELKANPIVRDLATYEPAVRDYLANKRQFEEWRSAQNAAPQTAPANQTAQPQQEQSAEKKPAELTAPPLSEMGQILLDRGAFQVDETTGLLQAKDPRAASYEKEVNEYVRWQQKLTQKIIRDPAGFIREYGGGQQTVDTVALRNELKQELLQELRNEQVGGQAQGQMEAFWHEHGDRFLQIDPTTKQPVQANGHVVLNDLGQKYDTARNEELASLKEDFGIDPNAMTPAQMLKVHQKVLRQIGFDPASPESPAAPQQPPSGQTKRKNFLRNTGRGPTRLSPQDVAFAKEQSIAAAARQDQQASMMTYEQLWDASAPS